MPEQKVDISPEASNAVRELLESAQRVLGLRLCLHEVGVRSGIPWEMRHQVAPACVAVRRSGPAADARCVDFDMRLTHRELAVLPQGRIQTCPHGFTELVVPVLNGAELLGVLFAGPCWFKRCKTGGTGLPVAPSQAWLKDRLMMLGGIAVRVGQLLVPEDKAVKRVDDRRLRIEAFIRDRLESELTLGMLAKELGLSPSRTSHAVGKVFGKPFSVVLCEARMRVGAQLLVTSDLPVADIAMKVGCEDPNYFSRLFRRHFGCPPRVYRERCRIV